MEKPSMEFAPVIGPDSLRELTRLMKALYDSHTKKYYGYEDINGSHYVGTVENFGPEMLFESRKILMDKPSLKNIFIENTFDFYFDIQYSGIVDTYDQQNMLCAVLKKDVLLSNKTYQIRFDNIRVIDIPRAMSWSDPNVIRDSYIHTKTPPKLVITNEDNSIDEIELLLTDEGNSDTDYYFHINHETSDLFDIPYRDLENVEPDLFTIDSLLTKPITDNMHGRPFVWMCINKFRLLPPVNFTNNDTDPNERPFVGVPILTIGTNGHNEALIYPAMRYREGINIRRIIKVYPVENESFVENENADVNYTIPVGEIHIMSFIVSEEDFEPSTDPKRNVNVITYDRTFSNIYLNKFSSSKFDHSAHYTGKYCGKWFFRRPKPGEYDYDGRTYNNRCYAFTSIESFFSNSGIVVGSHFTYNKSEKLVPGFKIHFDDKYLHKYEELCDNAEVGIHVDVTSDHSDYGVSKKNGVIYSMGDFDGLPPYFKYMIDDTIHRAHIEAYAIRDKINDMNQLPTEKQTAGIIIDSAIPQNEIQKITNDMPMSIKFNRENLIERIYEYDESINNPSKTNYLSEIVYVDENNFGNYNNQSQKLCPKFIYHGNRHFSLGMMGFDPELEMGRVYVISNDKASYENNETTDMTKSPITFARICDIPTDFSQLVNINNVAPTLIIDPEYVRMFASFTTKDKDALYNLTYVDKLIRSDNNAIVFNYNSFANFDELLEKQFPKYYNINESIDLSDTDNVIFEINSGGNGYKVNDVFSFYIGGICIKGIVTSMDEGSVTGVSYENKTYDGEIIYTDNPIVDSTHMTRSNFNSRLNVFDTKTVSGFGSGLEIKVSISKLIWESTKMGIIDVLDNAFYFQKNEYGDIWAYIYNNDAFIKDSQITGETLYENAYDGIKVQEKTIKNCLIYNMINPISNSITSIPIIDRTEFISPIGKEDMDEEGLWKNDLTDILNRGNGNIQNGLFMFNVGFEGVSNFHNIIRYEIGHINSNQKTFIHPGYSDLNYSNYTNKTNKFRFKNTETQPSLYLFDPTVDTAYEYSQVCKDVIKIENSRPMVFADFFTPEDNKNTIDRTGKLMRNIYISDEFDLSNRNGLMNNLNSLTREGLINYLKKSHPDSIPLKFEDTDYAYSKSMIINYIMQNTLRHGYDAKYTAGDETIYRKPEIKLFRQAGEQVVDKLKNPIGDQPKGNFKEVTSDKIESTAFIGKGEYPNNILFVFKLDTDNIDLNGVKVYDEMNNDVSNCSLLIVNGKKYIATNNRGTTVWCEINKQRK